MATTFDRVLAVLSGAGLPWVARVYFVLIVLFGIVLVWAATQQGASVLPDSDLRVKLFSLAGDSLKTVLGALLGSLSLAAEALWRAGEKASDKNDENTETSN